MKTEVSYDANGYETITCGDRKMVISPDGKSAAVFVSYGAKKVIAFDGDFTEADKEHWIEEMKKI